MDITISVDKREVYPNDKINCTIHVLVKNKTKTKRIVASFFGEFLSLFYGSKSTHTNRNVFVNLEKQLWIPEDKKSGTIEAGTYEYKVDFDVPDGLMPSFPPASMEETRFPGRLQYFIKAVATKVIGFEDERFEKIFIMSKDFASTTSERRRFGTIPGNKTRPMASVTLDRSTYKPGEMVNCQIVVDKRDANCTIQDTNLTIRNKCWGWVEGSWHIEDIFRDEYNLGNMDSPSPKTFTLMVPVQACPTDYGGNVKITWDVHLHVKLSLAKDVHLTVPIVVVAAGATVPAEDSGSGAAPGARFCPSCGTLLETGSNTCKLCNDVLDES